HLEFELHDLEGAAAGQSAFALRAGDAQPRAAAGRPLLGQGHHVLHQQAGLEAVAPLREQHAAAESRDAAAALAAEADQAPLAARPVCDLRLRLPRIDAARRVGREGERARLGLLLLLLQRLLALDDDALQGARRLLVRLRGLAVDRRERRLDPLARLVDLAV